VAAIQRQCGKFRRTEFFACRDSLSTSVRDEPLLSRPETFLVPPGLRVWGEDSRQHSSQILAASHFASCEYDRCGAATDGRGGLSDSVSD
jgi:hypothetical protein